MQNRTLRVCRTALCVLHLCVQLSAFSMDLSDAGKQCRLIAFALPRDSLRDVQAPFSFFFQLSKDFVRYVAQSGLKSRLFCLFGPNDGVNDHGTDAPE